MKKFRKTTIVLLALAAVLLLSSAVGSTRAALTYYSENYSAEVTVSNIGVSLLENGNIVSARNYDKDGEWIITEGTLLQNMLAEDETFILGKEYDEKLAVLNSGAIDTYVRVILTKNWVDAEGNVDQTLDPSLIKFEPVTGENGWVIDKNATTDERVVLYFTEPVPSGAHTGEFTNTISVDPTLQTKVVKTVKTDDKGLQTITYEYEYDGYSFNVEAEVDAVQTHNAADAIKSAWGIDVTVADNGDISLQ